jgi:hypothetical protein
MCHTHVLMPLLALISNDEVIALGLLQKLVETLT